LEAFENDSNFVINEQVEVFATPGHTLDSVSVSVKSSKGGLISESFSLWLKSPSKDAKSFSSAISHWYKFGIFIWRFEPK
jgi:hypothetical protein